MAVRVDVSELRTLSTAMARIPDKVQRGVRPVVSKGALNIKQELQMDLASSQSFRGITFSVNYDVKVTAGGVEAEIGPDKDKYGGALANVAIFGTSRGGGTVPDPSIALMAEADRFETALGDLFKGLL
ncbi:MULTISPECIES: hypothetical protein [Brachybacterium]|uniref:HK97 gp10 family phage protein n=2 Tax=Brachybacterium TaxID=43668 RepID=A0A426SJA4_9MICO|nr:MULTISPECIES: hypothetical protein [Brachybacterium]RRR18253.1 hypothetical protein DS079_10930 [Brachybacterium paraconglomeratum]GLI30359.1 hypothetical protein BCONGLO52_12000 [Brachybacterium conglomeratum]GLK04897.1 hypothetical protein GCM10017597_16970 [Brachybacterium conglomeratum]